jgi:hypothetical protein
MNPAPRTLFRLAGRIRDRLLAQEQRRLGALMSVNRSLSKAMRRYLDLGRQAAKAHSRKWSAAARNLHAQAAEALDDMHYQLEGARRQARPDLAPPICGAGDILRDLRQIEEEFGAWDFDEDEESPPVPEEDPIEEDLSQVNPRRKKTIC